MNKFWNIVLVILGIAIYCNIGFWVGDYMYWQKDLVEQDAWAKFLFGGWGLLSSESFMGGNHGMHVIASMFLWPIVLLITLVLWTLYGIFGGGLFEVIGMLFSLRDESLAGASFIAAFICAVTGVLNKSKILKEITFPAAVLFIILFLAFL